MAPAANPTAVLGVVPVPPPSGGYRVLAPGVETTIPSPVTAADQVSRHDLVGILAEQPTYGQRPDRPSTIASPKGVHFKHDVWGLDFTFKPIRFLRVPGKNGNERLIWYMVYHVRNRGEKPFLFLPSFALESHDVKQTYNERVMPELVPLIQNREDKHRKLLSTVDITGQIPSSPGDEDLSVWGVVMWEGIDPHTDRFSIFIDGLTNAYQWKDPEGGVQPSDPPAKGRTYHHQVLKLNFWRPSDTKFQHEDEIRFGIPGDVDYEWFYK